MSGVKPLRGTIWNFCARKVSGERHRLIYAHSLNVTEEDLLGEMSYPSNDASRRSVSINEGESEAMTSYYEGSGRATFWLGGIFFV